MYTHAPMPDRLDTGLGLIVYSVLTIKRLRR